MRNRAPQCIFGLSVVLVASFANGQVLRPQSTGADGILTAELVGRATILLPVPAERAYDAWTEATQLVEWFAEWAEMTVAEGEPYAMGWEGFGTWNGTYLEVDRPQRLTFTWLPPEEFFPAGAYETVVSLSFEEKDGRTTLVLEHSGFRGAEELQSQVDAWSGYLYALRAFLLQPPSSD